jgi:SAM-dependent methyltransferase
MDNLSELEKVIYNQGERLIPGISHNFAEFVRHRSSYAFFREVIRRDLLKREISPLRIVDLGCGVGHGCLTLAQIPEVAVLGIDNSAESLDFARIHYAAPNITYEQADLVEYIETMPEFDYVVSRNVFEHIPDGLQVAARSKWRQRLMFDAPYDEGEGNPHHFVHHIREEAFSIFPNSEVFFQDLHGVMYNEANKPGRPNVIMCVSSQSALPKINDLGFQFPLPLWQNGDGFGIEDFFNALLFIDRRQTSSLNHEADLVYTVNEMNKHIAYLDDTLARALADNEQYRRDDEQHRAAFERLVKGRISDLDRLFLVRLERKLRRILRFQKRMA